MRHFNDGPRVSLKEQVFHMGLTSDRNLMTIFHELNPDADDYMNLDYNVLDLEPVFNPKTGNSMSFIASDDNLDNKVTLVVTTNQWNKTYFEFLLYSVVRYSLALSNRLKLRNPMDLDMDICILYTGETENITFDSIQEIDQSMLRDERYKPLGTEQLHFRTLAFESSEPDENEIASIFFKYWRFIQILEENQKKYPSGFESFRKTIKQCIDEDIFPELFKRRRRF